MKLKRKKDMITDRGLFAVAYDDKIGDIYVFGGYGNGKLDLCEKYSLNNN